ncbi:MAG: hypothetical protein AAF611_08315 [Bacteroidota bacterium]
MKKILIFIIAIMAFSCSSEKNEITQVAAFTGQQVTGVTVSDGGIIFANFPR